MNQISLQRETLEVLSTIISETLTHNENLFLQHEYKNICYEGNKSVRVYNTFVSEYNSTQKISVIFNVLFSLINPVQFTTQEEYDDLLYRINTALAHDGLRLSFDNGKKQLHKTDKARNINDAKTKANQLKQILESRGIHPYVLRFCKAELLKGVTTSMFRNPTAHEAKIYWPIFKEEAIDLLTINSFTKS